MSGSLNKVQLIGHLGRDPEMHQSKAGDLHATLDLATSEAWTDRESGERRQRTEWHHVVIFAGPLVKVTETYLRKGSRVYVEGSLQTRTWTDQNGQKRYTTEIILRQYNGSLQLLDGPRSVTESAEAMRPANGRKAAGAQEIDDEIPF